MSFLTTLHRLGFKSYPTRTPSNKDYKHQPESSEAMIRIGMINLTLHRL